MQTRHPRDQRGITNRSTRKNYGGVRQASDRIKSGPVRPTKKLSDEQKRERSQNSVVLRRKKIYSHIRYLQKHGLWPDSPVTQK